MIISNKLTKLLVLVFLTILVFVFFLFIKKNKFKSQLTSVSNQKKQENAISNENKLSGTSEWIITKSSKTALCNTSDLLVKKSKNKNQSGKCTFDGKNFRSKDLEGYTWSNSAKAGDTVNFSVSTTAASVSASI